MIDSFEKKWCEWSIDDTTQWFEFVLGGNDKNKDDSSDSDSSDDEDDDETDEKKQEIINVEVDFKHVLSRLNMGRFNAKKELPVLVKAFQFERFGFKNKRDRKLLVKKTKQLVEKYPRIKRKKSKKKQKNDNVELEGFVQDTN